MILWFYLTNSKGGEGKESQAQALPEISSDKESAVFSDTSCLNE